MARIFVAASHKPLAYFVILEGAIRKTLLDYDRKFNTLTFTCLTFLSSTDATTTYILAKALLIFQRVPFRRIG